MANTLKIKVPKGETFLFRELVKLNSDITQLTLRKFLWRECQTGTIKHIDSISGAKGRTAWRYKLVA